MAKYGRGLVCMPLDEKRIEELEINPVVKNNTDKYETAFTVSIDHMDTTTGISAFERALTIKKVLKKGIKWRFEKNDFRKPGHVFPLKAKEGGVLKRIGHTEVVVDLGRLAGLKPAGVICEIMDEDGTMARTPELMIFAKKHNLKIITITDLISYRKHEEKLVKRVVETNMPTKHGGFKIYGEHHVALVKGDISTREPVLARVHSECSTGDALGSKRGIGLIN